MSYISPEGIVIPAGGDNWNLTTDLRTQAASTRSLVPVVDRPAGDIVATAMASDGRAVSNSNPLAIWNQGRRTIEVKDATGWQSTKNARILFGPGTAGRLTAFPSAASVADGTVTPIIQTGSYVITTDASGYFSFSFPIPFPNGIASTLFMNGDAAASGRDKIMSIATAPFTNSLSTVYGSVVNSGGAAYASLAFRVEYIAFGW